MNDYNTSREPMKLREFGRNVQNLAKFVNEQESKEERTKYAEALIELMKQVVPSAKDNQEGNQRLWDDLYILADFKLDVDGPYPIPEQKILDKKPGIMGYSDNNIRFRHYGRNIVHMVEEAKTYENPEEKEAAVYQIARLMKSFHVTWNKETPDNELIAKNIKILSGGDLELNLSKAIELELLDPLYKDKPRPANRTNDKNKGKGGKPQNRRRRFK
jgi:hypothetical protein